jgi:hypothetical protein
MQCSLSTHFHLVDFYGLVWEMEFDSALWTVNTQDQQKSPLTFLTFQWDKEPTIGIWFQKYGNGMVTG